MRSIRSCNTLHGSSGSSSDAHLLQMLSLSDAGITTNQRVNRCLLPARCSSAFCVPIYFGGGRPAKTSVRVNCEGDADSETTNSRTGPARPGRVRTAHRRYAWLSIIYSHIRSSTGFVETPHDVNITAGADPSLVVDSTRLDSTPTSVCLSVYMSVWCLGGAAVRASAPGRGVIK